MKTSNDFHELLVYPDPENRIGRPEIQAGSDIAEWINAFKSQGLSHSAISISQQDCEWSLELSTHSHQRVCASLNDPRSTIEPRGIPEFTKQGTLAICAQTCWWHFTEKVFENNDHGIKRLGVMSLLRSTLEKVVGVLESEVTARYDRLIFLLKRGYIPKNINSETKDRLEKSIIRILQGEESDILIGEFLSLELDVDTAKKWYKTILSKALHTV